MSLSKEPIIQRALSEYHAGVWPSYRAAAAAYDLNHTTLMRRDKGLHSDASNGHSTQMKLDQDLEKRLIKWILYYETCGHPVSHVQIREFVLLLLRATNQPQVIGKSWVSRFIKRHQDITIKIGQKIDVQRVNNTNKEQLSAWFSRLEALIVKLHLNPINLYNCDKTGIALGVYTNTKVVSLSSTRKIRVKQPENRE